MNDRRATSQNEVARPVYSGMRYTYYESKAFSRLGGVARCLGLNIQETSWDPETHTATILFGASEDRCKAFIEAASMGIRKARYECVSGGVKVKFLATAAEKRIPVGRHAAHQLPSSQTKAPASAGPDNGQLHRSQTSPQAC